MELWKAASPEDYFEFHPYATYSEEEEEEEKRPENNDEEAGSDSEQEDEEMVKTSTEGLLFVHQTKDQRRLLERYGNEISMLDATYKTTRYSLPLFLVVVKSNVDYQIVGSFVIQSETTDAIYEALSVLLKVMEPQVECLVFYGALIRRGNVCNWQVVSRYVKSLAHTSII